MCSVTASHAKDPGFDSRRLPNRLEWWLSPGTMQWLEKSSLVTLLGFKLKLTSIRGIILLSWECGTAMILTGRRSSGSREGQFF